MPSHKEPAPPATHRCPVCRLPQTKIQRILGAGKCGSVSYVCSRAGMYYRARPVENRHLGRCLNPRERRRDRSRQDDARCLSLSGFLTT